MWVKTGKEANKNPKPTKKKEKQASKQASKQTNKQTNKKEVYFDFDIYGLISSKLGMMIDKKH